MTNNDDMATAVHELVSAFAYGYVTVYRNDTSVCEGFTGSLMRTMDLASLPVKSFYVFEAEDGSVFIDLHLQ